MNKDIVFKKELKFIKNKKLKESAKKIINTLPEYFFEIAASSTGKYHPQYTVGNGGLVRHTKVVVRIAHELLNNNKTIGNYFTSKESDLIIIALLIHDGFKLGLNKGKYTVVEHPLLMSQHVIDNYKKFNLILKDATLIADIIATHMGEWTKDYQGNEVLSEPITKYQKFGHLCDYLASRKFLNVEFENNEIRWEDV